MNEKLELKIDNVIFEDMRTMIDRQIDYIIKNLTEEDFVDGEITVKINVTGYNVAKAGEEKIITPSIKYKVSSNLKKALSEDNSLFFEDRIIAKDKVGNYYLQDYSGDQINMME